MDREQVITEVNKILAKEFELTENQLIPDALLKDDLSLDSLDAVELLTHLEELLDIEVDVEKFREVKALGDVYNIIFEIAKTVKA